jgi:acyl carrier protein
MDKNKQLGKIQNEIINYLKKHGKLPKNDISNFRYLDHGIIDSLNLIKFIIFLEKKFKIKLKAIETESDEFRYIIGLVKLILKKINEKK